MCNLYSVTTNKEAIRQLAKALGEWTDQTGNFEPLSGVFPDQMAPVVPFYARWRTRANQNAMGLCAVNATVRILDGGDALPKMRVGPSKSAYRSRLQTATSCIGQEPLW
jgi:putative SOS response-associated peptidase YedK